MYYIKSKNPILNDVFKDYIDAFERSLYQIEEFQFEYTISVMK